jgi:hypothetical protein
MKKGKNKDLAKKLLKNDSEDQPRVKKKETNKLAPKEMMNTMAFVMIRNIAYKQIAKMNKEIKETIEVESDLLDIIDINMKNQINGIIYNYKQKVKKELEEANNEKR